MQGICNEIVLFGAQGSYVADTELDYVKDWCHIVWLTKDIRNAFRSANEVFEDLLQFKHT